jgi:hypothetical protein
LPSFEEYSDKIGASGFDASAVGTKTKHKTAMIKDLTLMIATLPVYLHTVYEKHQDQRYIVPTNPMLDLDSQTEDSLLHHSHHTMTMCKQEVLFYAVLVSIGISLSKRFYFYFFAV